MIYTAVARLAAVLIGRNFGCGLQRPRTIGVRVFARAAAQMRLKLYRKKFDESLRERIKRGYGRLKPYRRGRAPVGAKFCLCDADAQNFIFGAAESARKFLCGTDCADTSRLVKFRLPRRMNFGSPARLNLKLVLLW